MFGLGKKKDKKEDKKEEKKEAKPTINSSNPEITKLSSDISRIQAWLKLWGRLGNLFQRVFQE